MLALHTGIHGSIFKVFSSEKELIPIKFFGSTLEYWHRKISALGLICLIRPVMVSSSSSDTKSVLLRSIRSAKSDLFGGFILHTLGFFIIEPREDVLRVRDRDDSVEHKLFSNVIVDEERLATGFAGSAKTVSR